MDEAKEARLAKVLKKKQIREGKRKAGESARAESRKKSRRDNELEAAIPNNPDEDVIPKKGKK